jgi:hypothetical protein
MATAIAEHPTKAQPIPAARPRTSAGARTRGTVVPVMKKVCFGALGVAGLMTFLFLIDLFFSFPFAGASITLDIFGILAGAIVAYLAWDTAKEIR